MRLNKTDYFLIILFFITNLALRLVNLDCFIYDYDEGVYLYAAKLITQGYIPYKDFFLAHPPLLIYFNVFLSNIGLNYIGIRIVYTLISLVPLFFIYSIVKKFSKSTVTPIVAIFMFSASQFLFKYSKIAILDTTIGLFITLIIYLFLYKRCNFIFFLIGVLLAILFFIKIPALFILLSFIVIIILVRENLKTKVTYLFYLFLGNIIIIIPIFSFLLRINHFLDDVFFYQILREYTRFPERLELSSIPWHTSFFDVIIIVTGVIFAFYLILRGKNEFKEISLFAVLILSLELLLPNIFLNRYILHVFPILCILSAVFFDKLEVTLSKKFSFFLYTKGLSLTILILSIQTLIYLKFFSIGSISFSLNLPKVCFISIFFIIIMLFLTKIVKVYFKRHIILLYLALLFLLLFFFHSFHNEREEIFNRELRDLLSYIKDKDGIYYTTSPVLAIAADKKLVFWYFITDHYAASLYNVSAGTYDKIIRKSDYILLNMDFNKQISSFDLLPNSTLNIIENEFYLGYDSDIYKVFAKNK